MAVSIRGAIAPFRDVAKYGYAAVAVYSLLFESAERDFTFHKPGNSAPYITGGTTYWSHKAIAETLHMGKATVIKSIDKLLDDGFITVIGYAPSTTGSMHRVYRVLHPKHIEDQRFVLGVIGGKSSERQKRIDKWNRGGSKTGERGPYEEHEEELSENPAIEEEISFFRGKNQTV